MKSVISGLLVAFSMYSAIPVPQVNWKKQTMRWALGFLPLIGVLIGAIEWFWFAFCVHFGAAGVFYAVIAALIPLAVSGGIHLDGLCDTCDALCSFGDREKRLAILKDPHVGAFGPLWLMAFLLAEVGCFAQIYDQPVLLPLACTGFVLHGQWAAARWLRHRARKTADLHISLRKTAINERYHACWLLNLFCLRCFSDCGYTAYRTRLLRRKCSLSCSLCGMLCMST